MEKKGDNISRKNREEEDQNNDNQNGYPPYSASEDIYSKCQEEKDINPEEPTRTKVSDKNSKNGTFNEKDFDDDLSGSDLDIPGSELDDDLEIIGSEDEENNYYSLGGDEHNDLDEDNGEWKKQKDYTN